jgi:hypothetical protein
MSVNFILSLQPVDELAAAEIQEGAGKGVVKRVRSGDFSERDP